jgi:hypothetical protein
MVLNLDTGKLNRESGRSGSVRVGISNLPPDYQIDEQNYAKRSACVPDSRENVA